MQITVNVIEDDNIVWITDDRDPIGVETSCCNKEELKCASDKYIKHFVDDFCSGVGGE